MRTAVILVATAAALVSCKKDRVCECTIQQEGSADKYTYSRTMVDAGYKTAFYACVHTKETRTEKSFYTGNDTTITTDSYCELK